MSTFLKCDLKKFVEALKPLIKEYKIEENEDFDLVINECYQRLIQANVNDGQRIEKLTNDYYNWRLFNENPGR
jgi:hypothetical protein